MYGDGYVVIILQGSNTIPGEDDDVVINTDVLVDVTTADLGKVTVNEGGRLLFKNGAAMDITFSAHYILISNGSLFVGAEGDGCCYEGKLTIRLLGELFGCRQRYIHLNSLLILEWPSKISKVSVSAYM